MIERGPGSWDLQPTWRNMLRARPTRAIVHLAASVAMITAVVVTFTVLFTQERAADYTAARALAERCIDESKLLCTDFTTSDAWLRLSNPDCVFSGLGTGVPCSPGPTTMTAPAIPVAATPNTTLIAAPPATSAPSTAAGRCSETDPRGPPLRHHHGRA